jgi:hypothetical protein
MRELINAKTSGADKERGVLQKEIDSLAMSTSMLESTSIPSAWKEMKEIEVLKKEIKRHNQSFNPVNRKIGLSKKGSVRVAQMIKANENTLLSQQIKLVVINKTVNKLQKEERELVLEGKRGKESLNRIYELL